MFYTEFITQDPRRLTVADLEDNDKSCRITPSSDYTPDGNCKRDLSSRNSSTANATVNNSKPSTSAAASNLVGIFLVCRLLGRSLCKSSAISC